MVNAIEHEHPGSLHILVNWNVGALSTIALLAGLYADAELNFYGVRIVALQSPARFLELTRIARVQNLGDPQPHIYKGIRIGAVRKSKSEPNI